MKSEEEFLKQFQNQVKPNQNGKSASQKRKWSKNSYDEPLLILPCNSMESLTEFMESNKKFVYVFMLDLLSKGIEKNRKKVEYFKIGVTPYIMQVHRKKMPETLTAMMDFFILEEMFEEAALCRDLLDKHTVNMLLESI